MRIVRHVLAAALVVAAAPAAADTAYAPCPPIGTTIPASGIATHLDSISYGTPRLVKRNGATAWEVLISLSGVAYGGEYIATPAPPAFPFYRLSPSHFTYTVDGVVRWPRGHWDTLVAFVHGQPPAFAIAPDPAADPLTNSLSIQYTTGDFVSTGAIEDHCAFFALSFNGIRRGAHSGHTIDGPVPGAIAVPYSVTLLRDATRAVEDLLQRLDRRRPEWRILFGYSRGASLATEIFGGMIPPSFHRPQGERTGDNHEVCYDASSPTIFQAGILLGFGRANPVIAGDAFSPIPMTMIGEEGDPFGAREHRFTDEVRKVLAARGESLSDWVNIIHIRNAPHGHPDAYNWYDPLGMLASGPPPDPTVVNFPDGERIGPCVAAVLRNVRRVLDRGDPLLPSRYGGTLNPVLQDPAIDRLQGVAPIVLTAAEQAAWEAVKVAIPPTEGILLPIGANRLGGYDMSFNGLKLARPFDDLCARYGSLAGWRKAVERTAKDLEQEGYYVRSKEKDFFAYPPAETLFEAQGCPEKE